jgi:hypothetical protein
MLMKRGDFRVKMKVVSMGLAAMLGLALAAAEEPNWRFDSSWDIPSGEVHLLTQSATSKPSGACGNSDGAVLLSFACQRDSTFVMSLDFTGECGAQDRACIRYKVDGGPATEECSFRTTVPGGQAYVSDHTVNVLKALLGKTRLLMEIPTDNSPGRLTAEFNIGGLAERLPALQPYCDVRALLTRP